MDSFTIGPQGGENSCDVGAIIQAIASLAWPLLLGFFLWYFRDEIRKGFSRITHFGPGGVDLTPQTPVMVEADSGQNAEQLLQLSAPWATVGIWENSIRADLDARQLAPADREALLIRELAENRLAIAFERLYLQIFGSQITLLQELNVAPVVLARAYEIFQQAAASWPSVYAAYSFDRWLAFLQASGLIDQAGETISPTPAVSEFLAYLAWRRVSFQKAG